MLKKIFIFVCLLVLLLPINPTVFASGDDSGFYVQPGEAVSHPVLCEDGDIYTGQDCEHPIAPVYGDGAGTADPVSDEQSVSPYGLTCGNCGGNMVFITAYTPFNYTGAQRFCRHYPYGVDLELSRVVVPQYKCTRCGHIDRLPSYTETKWECHGFMEP